MLTSMNVYYIICLASDNEAQINKEKQRGVAQLG